MTKIQFVRELRDCPANDQAKAKGGKLTYDFAVIIDGERRARMARTGASYEMLTLDHQRILLPGQTYMPDFNQNGFEDITRTCLEAGVIPTLEQYRDRHNARERQYQDKIAAYYDRLERERFAEHGERMLDALKSAARIAGEAREEWDAAPAGMRAGKIIIALSGANHGYRQDTDAIHDLIAELERPLPEPTQDQLDIFRWEVATGR